MPLYRSLVNHGDMRAGVAYDIPDAEVGQWAGEIEAGFLQLEPEAPLLQSWPGPGQAELKPVDDYAIEVPLPPSTEEES